MSKASLNISLLGFVANLGVSALFIFHILGPGNGHYHAADSFTQFGCALGAQLWVYSIGNYIVEWRSSLSQKTN